MDWFNHDVSIEYLNPLSATITKSSKILKQFVGKLPTNCLSVFDHFVILALKGLMKQEVLNNIRAKLTSIFQVFSFLSFRIFNRHITDV